MALRRDKMEEAREMGAAGVIFDLDLSVVRHVRQGMDDVGVWVPSCPGSRLPALAVLVVASAKSKGAGDSAEVVPGARSAGSQGQTTPLTYLGGLLIDCIHPSTPHSLALPVRERPRQGPVRLSSAVTVAATHLSPPSPACPFRRR